MKRIIYLLVCTFWANWLAAQSCSQSPLVAIASNTDINSGQTSTLSHTGCVGGKVVWTNPSNAVISNLAVTPATTTDYKATCTFSATDVCTSTVKINVYPNSCILNATSNKASIIIGENATLSATGCASGTISWRDSDGNSISSLTVNPQISTNYIATCTYPTGQSCSSAVSVAVSAACFIDAFSSVASINSGENATLSSVGCEGGTISWTDGNSVAITNLTVSPTSNTTYTVKCTMTGGSTCTDQVSISVSPVCTVTASASVANLVAGQSSALSATGCTGGQLSWRDAQNNVIGSSNSVNVNPAVTTTYKVLCSYPTGSSCNSEVTVLVSPACTISAKASSLVITSGQSSVLSHTGCENGLVSWKTGTTGITNLVVSPTSTTKYTVTCTYSATTTCTSEVTVTVNPTCGLTATATNLSFILGQSTTISATGCLASSPVVWKNSQNQVITTTSITPTATGTYTYTATCATSTSTSCVSTVSFVVNPVCAIIASATDLNITSGQSTTLTSTGCVGGFVTWQDANNIALTSLQIKPSATTTYKATCNYAGVTATCNNSVTINVFPICNVTAKATKNTTAAGTINSFTLSQTGCATGGTATWSTGSTTLSGASPIVTPSSTTVYKVVCSYGANSSPCESSVTVKGFPACTLSGSASATTVAAGTSITLSNTGCTGGTVRWKDDAGNLLTTLNFKPKATKSYTATCSYEGANICTSVVTVTVNYAISIGTVTSVKPTCGNVDNGSLLVPLSRGITGSETSIKLTLTLGTASIGTFFTNSNSFAVIKNLKAGNYSLKVETLNGSTVLATVSSTHIIQNGDNIAYTPTVVDVKCFGGTDGEIKLTATGGKAPYTYDFDNLNKYTAFDAATIANIKKQKTDTLIVKVKDAQGCVSAPNTIIINQPKAALVATAVSQVNPLGFETRDGQATVSVTGGTPDYTFEWADSSNVSYGKGVTTGVTTNKNSTLRGGTYTVKIFDKNYALATDKLGCTTSKTFKLVEPPQLKIVFTPVKQPSCADRADGKFSVVLSGGVPFDTGIKYKLLVKHKTSDYQDNDKLSYDFVPGGQYTLTITDKNNISRTLEFKMPAPTAIVPQIKTIKNLLCNSDKTGAFEISPSGGTGPYTAVWNNNLTGLALSGLSAGKYVGLVYDSLKCDALVLVEVKQPLKLEAKFEVFQPLCADNCNGTLNASIVGGTAPYSYTWADGNKTSLNLTKLCHETIQTISITDKNQCVAVFTNKMPTRQKLTIPLAKDKFFCAGSKILLDATIANANSYLWVSPNGSTFTEAKIIPDREGIYNISVKDSLNCEFSTNINVQASTTEAPKVSFTTSSEVGANQKFVIVNLLNPLPNTTTWVLPVQANDIKLSDFEAILSLPNLGEFEVGMQASFAQCETYQTTKVKVVNALDLNQLAIVKNSGPSLKVSANPSNGKFVVSLAFSQESTFKATVWDLNAKSSPIFEVAKQGQNEYNFEVDLSEKQNGSYLLIVTDNFNNTLSKKLVFIK